MFETISRRDLLKLGAVSAGASLLAGCVSSPRIGGPAVVERPVPVEPEMPAAPEFMDYASMYGPMEDEGFSIPAVPWEKIDPQFLRQVVPAPPGIPAGTLAVDTDAHLLYLVRADGTAMRYGVGLGRAGFEWQGNAVIQWKQKWPTWTPPAEMIARDPKLEKWSAENGGQPGGLKNPLGARALYIFQGGEDTLFRVHGSPEWNSIGKSVSSGCVRLINQDIIDLYERVPASTPIMVGSGVAYVASARATRMGQAIDSGVPEGAVLLGRIE